MDEKQEYRQSQPPWDSTRRPDTTPYGTFDRARLRAEPAPLSMKYQLARLVFLSLVLFACVRFLLHQSTLRLSWRPNRGEETSTDSTANNITLLKHHNSIIQLQSLPHHLLPGHNKRNHKRRLIVVGDVHGCKSSLLALLSKIDFTPSLDHLILAGDMIDKGPDSHGVISLARKLGASCVRGNHEDKVLSMRDHPDAWTHKMSSSAFTLSRELSDADVEWLRKCPLILSLGKMPWSSDQKETVVVHAGLVPGVELEAQEPFQVMRMRSIEEVKSKKGKVELVANEGRDMGRPWWEVWNREQERLAKSERTLVLYGHDSKTGLNERKWSVGLDSACVSGGRLSAMVIEGEGRRKGAGMSIKSVKC